MRGSKQIVLAAAVSTLGIAMGMSAVAAATTQENATAIPSASSHFGWHVAQTKPGDNSEAVKDRMKAGDNSEAVKDRMKAGDNSESVKDRMKPGDNSESVKDRMKK